MRIPNLIQRVLASLGGAACILLLAGGTAQAAVQQINLTAAPAAAPLPDGSSVPMWGYSCGTAVGGSTAGCAALNPATATGGTAAGAWSPVIITLPAGEDLQINLSNSLQFANGNGVPTSLMIVGQVGGGLGVLAQRTTTAAPDHSNAQANVTWPIAGAAGKPGVPPVQPARVQSFGTEVAPGTTTSLSWTAPRPGTYLIESGTHPSIQGPMGLYGMLVVTTAPTASSAGTAYPAAGSAAAVSYSAEVPLVMSEIDPLQNSAVDAAVNTLGFSETMVWSGLPGGCGNPLTATGTVNPVYGACYPPAVNYSPLYYLFNGVAFNKTNAAGSLFPATAAGSASGLSGSVLVRLVNAGLRMHVPAIVNAQTGSANTAGFALIAEDGNPLPGVTRVQSEVFMAAGKTYDLMLNVPATAVALPVYDRQLSLSANATARDAGMLAYIGLNAGLTNAPAVGVLPAAAVLAPAVARADSYNSVVSGQSFTVSDPAKGVIGNDTNVYGVSLLSPPSGGTVVLNRNGTFVYTAAAGTTSDSFSYCANGVVTATGCSSGITASVTLGAAPLESAAGISVIADSYTSSLSTSLTIKPPGILANDKDGAGYPLTVSGASPSAPLSLALTGSSGTGTVIVDPNGGFSASVTAPGSYTFSYAAQNSQGTVSSATATVTLTFPAPSNLAVTVIDGTDKVTPITDYRWIIEEDRTFYINPACTSNPPPIGASCPTFGSGQVPTFGTNFHTSYMPVVATGCVGTLACENGQTVLGQNAVCDVGNGVCRTSAPQQTPVPPSAVHLDPSKRYYLSILPGDAANPFIAGNLSANCTNGSAQAGSTAASCGHGMGGAPIAAGQTAVTVLTQPTPFPPAKLSVFVYEDDFPLNGEQDGGGGVDVLSPVEPGLGGFNITIMDDAGGPGDPTGQVDYDMFNQPLSNSLAGTIDPATGQDACPVSKISRIGKSTDLTQTGITGTIVTCPKYEADGATLSPLAGQAVVANMMPGRYGVVATPAADRIARGEEWLQTNTLDGQKAHDSFLRIGEPSFFQEYGPAGYHVSIGFANPAIINSRLKGICNNTDPNLPLGTAPNCSNTLTGLVTTERMSRTPDERLYSSGSRASFAFTQCYVSVGDPDGEDFAFTKCDANGNFTLSGLPDGNWRITTFDQWNDQLVDGLSTPVALSGGNTVHVEIAANQWQANFSTRTFLDLNGDGVSGVDAAGNPEPGLALVKTNVRFRDGSFSNRNNTDLNGYAAFNEEFPLFSWYVIETDVTRFKNTGTHVVYDAGGPADNTPCGSATSPPTAPCGSSLIADHLANTVEQVSLPVSLRVPGAVYCAGADCTGKSIANGPTSSDPPSACTTSPTTGATTCTQVLSTGRIDPPWVLTEGWQGFSGQNNIMEFGKKPYAAGENGGIRGHVVYSSTRPFDDPQFGTQNVWEPLVPNVTINLYRETTAPDGSTALALVDHTLTSSWDVWAQGFRSDGIPNINCPGQLGAPTTSASGDLFFFSIYDQPNYLDWYNAQHGGAAYTPLPYNSQFKCYDGMHNWNQVQPAPYDGMYQFPSVTGMNPATGKPTGTNCSVCVANPDTSDPYRSGLPMLPKGKYVVEVVVPPGYELVKEEDKNILIGDNFIAPATVQFPGLGSAIYILPDQAEISSAFNANNAQNPTVSLGRNQTLTSHEGDTPTIDTFWPCVGAARIVPDFISLFPQSAEVAPFAGATRNLCDRKEVTLDDQTSSQAEFFIFTSTHAAAHFTGVITDDFTSEFDPFSPQFGEKFSPVYLPVAIKDWTGNEISRVYADQWGTYNGLTYSTWEVNPPNPTGYSPTMMITCMNDPGTGATPDPLFNPAYSQFCYEIPFMPGNTQYMDTPVVPTAGFAGAGYNNVDCAYPDSTPAVSEVDGDGIGPWVSAAGGTHILKIFALGNQTVNNYGYSGPATTTAPFNQKTVSRHYGFGSATGTVALIGSDGLARPLTGVSWSDGEIIGTVPTGVPNCPVQQQAQYKGASAQCGQLVITTASGRKSVDTVTVTIGGKAPTHVAATASVQSAIDLAAPGDMLMIDPAVAATASAAPVPAVHQELLLMWKPVRLQGVGAASSVINANTHPAGKLDAWRRQVNCMFGLAINGQPPSAANPYDPTGKFSCPAGPKSSNNLKTANFSGTPTTLAYFVTSSSNPQIDRLPLEAVVGWDASQNGNLAELLQEPSLMGALEGAGITVLSKGLTFPAGSDPFGTGATAAGAFPTGTTLLDGSTNSSHGCGSNSATAVNPFPSNFSCNPSSIDGLQISDSSQGGGGIFVHGWSHNIQIANNRIMNNAGSLSGGINVGQGEFPPAYTVGGTNADPGSCRSGSGQPAGTELPYCFDLNVNMHNNAIVLNSSTGDELFSATPAGAGGVSITNGSDFYHFSNNWVCGNLSTGDGGGVAHIGFSYNGDIENNTILFNQSTNPTIATNGGGLLIMGAPDSDPTCGATTDQDCVSSPPVGPADGVGPGLVINANLIMGNAAEAGSGGGLRLQNLNGTDVITFPTAPGNWYAVTVTNNIIANNVAGWDGAGISLQDALKVNIINNTIVSNDTTASSGVLFNTLGAPLASAAGSNCIQTNGTSSCPQPAGVVTVQNSTNLTANLPATIVCPSGHYAGSTASNGSCRTVSYPELYNNVIWQNRAFDIGVGGLGIGAVNQQNVVALYTAFTNTVAPSQPQADATTANGAGLIVSGGTGACTSGVSYWDIGVRGDSGPANHLSGVTLHPTYTVLTDATDYPGANNSGGNPTFQSQYCNGSRVPPELGSMGYQVPPGISDATVPNPIFALTPAATVDEGNNWINISWGPLSLSNPAITAGSTGYNVALGSYGPTSTSSTINYIPSTAATYAAAPGTDFYGNARKANNAVDAGAVEFGAGAITPVLLANVSPSPLAFGNWAVGTTSNPVAITVSNFGNTALAGGTFTLSAAAPFTRVTTGGFPAGAPNCGATLAVAASCTIKIRFAPTAAVSYAVNLTVAYTGAAVTGSPVSITGTGVTGRAPVSITPNPATITLATGTVANTGVLTFTNTAAAGGSSVAVSNVAVSSPGSSILTWFFLTGALAGPDTCSGQNIAPGQSCTVTVAFVNVLSPRGVNRAGTVTFTDSGTPVAPSTTGQSGALVGHANP